LSADMEESANHATNPSKMSLSKTSPAPSIDVSIDRRPMDARALVRSDWARLGLCVVVIVAADQWFGIPVFVSIPAAFLGVLVYGYFAKERSARRRADLMAAATAAWDAVEAAALKLQEAESEGASAAIMAEREEAYAAALDRSAIVAKHLADYRSLQGAGRTGRSWRR
jgi:hypothetical protein